MTGGCDSSMLRRRAGVCAPVPQGVGWSSRDTPPLLGEYIPTRVEAVRLSIERVLLGGVSSFDLRSKYDRSLVSRTRVGGDEDWVEVGVGSNFRRGIGRRMGRSSFIMKGSGCSGFQRRQTESFRRVTSPGLGHWHPAPVAANKRSTHQSAS